VIVHRHVEITLVALTQKMPEPASVILARLRAMPEPTESMAIEVCRMTIPRGTPDASNGDSVVVICRSGMAITAMLRRSWNQPFTPEKLRVDKVESWCRVLTSDPLTAAGA
jgi:hypothetical protein